MKRLYNFITSNYRLGTALNINFLFLIYLITYWKFFGKLEVNLNLKYNNKSFSFLVNNRMDLAVLTEIFVNEEYKFSYTGSPKTILDLGANVGDTAIFYSILFPEAKVFAAEPNPHVHEKLIANTINFPNIKVCKCAVSDHTGKINLNFGDSHLGSSINAREQNTNSVEVDVYSLVDFCKKENIDRIDILKFDIEGAEQYLIKNISDNASSLKITQLVGEMHDDLSTVPLEPLIKDLNLKNIEYKTLNKKRYILFAQF